MQGRDFLLAKHGLAVMIVGLLGGFAWTFALIEQVSLSPIPIVFADSFPGDPANWRAVHIGCLTNGIMALAIAGVMPRFSLSASAASRVTYSVIFAIWGNTVFYFANLIAPNRSLSLGDNALGEGTVAGAVGYTTAVIGAVVLIYALCVMLFSKQGEDA